MKRLPNNQVFSTLQRLQNIAYCKGGRAPSLYCLVRATGQQNGISRGGLSLQMKTRNTVWPWRRNIKQQRMEIVGNYWEKDNSFMQVATSNRNAWVVPPIHNSQKSDAPILTLALFHVVTKPQSSIKQNTFEDHGDGILSEKPALRSNHQLWL